MGTLLSLTILESKNFIFALATLYAAFRLIPRAPPRHKQISPEDEHVLIIGASSGVGKELAKMYAKRGSRVCLVSRNEEQLKEAEKECLKEAMVGKVFSVVADFSDVEDMVRVRDTIHQKWKRLDTLAVIAGVSCLRPVLETAGVDGKSAEVKDASPEGLSDSIRISKAAMQGNFDGPYLSAITFTPLLLRTSISPSILLMSSAASTTPAPTRALYCASKSASLIFYQSLAIENPSLNLTVMIPGTIEGNFRASAVDAGPIRENDPNKYGLSRSYVARRCIEAVDWKKKAVFMPAYYRFIPLLYYTPFSHVIEFIAKRKYHYP